MEEVTLSPQNGRDALNGDQAADLETGNASKVSPASAATHAVTVENRRLMRATSVGGLYVIISPTKAFERLADIKDEASESVPSHLSIKMGIDLPVLGRILWTDLKRDAWEWLKNPLHLALLVWIIGVAISGAILFMVMVGMLDAVLPTKSDRDIWFEVSNQVINGLFTLMCVLVQPTRARFAIRLYQWAPKDILVMRTAFCRDGKRKPKEWKHMVVVVALLNGNCIFQYCLSGFNWGYTRAERPAMAIGIPLALSFGCAAGAGLYQMLSPLGKDYALVADDKAELAATAVPFGRFGNWLEKSKSFGLESQVVPKPEWVGEVVSGACMNQRTALLSCFCTICVHGINQDRLGFGNKYVHMITFAFFLVAPFLIFDLAAVNINNWDVKRYIGGLGIGLSVLGVFYGGYWRTMMRKTYRLPHSRWCFNNSIVSDLATWLFCPCCALCQEVRTAEHYGITDAHFYDKELGTVAENGVVGPIDFGGEGGGGGEGEGGSGGGGGDGGGVEGAKSAERGEGSEQEMVPPKTVEVEREVDESRGQSVARNLSNHLREEGLLGEDAPKGDDSVV